MVAMSYVEDPRLEYMAFLEEDSYSVYYLAADPPFSFLFATTGL
jgi:hypothetical protein